MVPDSPPGGNAGGRSGRGEPEAAIVGTSAPAWPAIEPSDLPLDILLARLRDVSQPSPDQWYACCPAHLDDHPSLSITEADDLRLLIYCHAGCDYEKILQALDLRPKDLFPTRRALFIARETGRRRAPRLTPLLPASVPPGAVTPVSDAEVARFSYMAKRAWVNATCQVAPLAQQLKLPEVALDRLSVGRLSTGAWTFPEYDGRGRVVGITLRLDDGSKKALAGSRRGLTLPLPILEGWWDTLLTGPLYLAEGATDTAALLAMNCLAVGRPAAAPSAAVCAYLTEFLANHPALHREREVIVVGDNDHHGAGVKGAVALRSHLERTLGHAVHAARPQEEFKDVREQVTAGAWATGLLRLEQGPA